MIFIAAIKMGSQIANRKIRRHSKTLKALREWGGGAKVSENLRTSPFIKDLSNESTFRQIHFAGHSGQSFKTGTFRTCADVLFKLFDAY
jgi:hypothetical protein